MNSPIPAIPDTMSAVLLTGHGGPDKMQYRTDVPVPTPGAGEVLIRVGAAGVNNTDINTRLGWYSKSVGGATNEMEGVEISSDQAKDATWSGQALQFPRIQGADVCGTIVGTGQGVEPGRIGERVLIAPIQRTPIPEHQFGAWTFGAECDGGFAQYTKTFAAEAYAINSDYSDIELASFPCAYSTAENLLHRAGVGSGEVLLITGATGGVGSAAVQLAKRRGAEIIAIASADKADSIAGLGVGQVIPREKPLLEFVDHGSVDVVIDVVAGSGFGDLLEVLKPGGRYAVAGAIAGPIVEMDVRSLYLKDLSLFGCTVQDPEVFENLIGYIEREEIKPLVSKSYPLARIADAQRDFIEKKFTGKLVLYPE